MYATPKQHSTAARPSQLWDENVRRSAVAHARTIRPENVAVVTSAFGGKFVPLKMIPLLREDRIRSSQLRVNVQMAETADMLINPVRVSAVAYLVPKLAFDRFKDLGTINRSYNGQEEIDGSVVPWFEEYDVPQQDQFYRTLGLHLPEGDKVNTDYVEAYNAVWNYIARQRSSSLELRDRLDHSLAPAFWENTALNYVKPTFDDAMIEGTVPLTFTGGTDRLWVKSERSGGYGASGQSSPSGLLDWDDVPEDANGFKDWTGRIFAELEAESVEVSLANIDLARETAAWARLRTEYQGLDEEWMMDQLLSGVQLPEETMKHPILLDRATTIIGMEERYATDAANLEVSVADGRTSLTLNMRTPQVNTGGVVVVAAQVLPEQTYERRRDHYFVAKSVDELPNRTSDELDPQPVDIKTNAEVDERHSDPDDVFGYEPLNAKWRRDLIHIGGKYFRERPSDPWTEERNRIWDTDVQDPVLGPDFYLATTLKHEVFRSSNSDPFEFWLGGVAVIDGLTYFGPALRESTDDYDKVLSQVDTSRIDPKDAGAADDAG